VPSHGTLHTVREGQPGPEAELPAMGLGRQSISFNPGAAQLNIGSLFRVSCRPGASSAAAPKGAAPEFDPLSQRLGKACYSLEVCGAGRGALRVAQGRAAAGGGCAVRRRT
jgi:hypothetical protein